MRTDSRAARLLRKLVAEAGFDATTLATDLVVNAAQLEGYLCGELEMPFDRQLCLAVLVIERVPTLKRSGYALRGQVLAAMAVERGDTETHTGAPMSVRSLQQRGSATENADLA